MATPRDLTGSPPLAPSTDGQASGAAAPAGGTVSAPQHGCLTCTQDPAAAPPPPNLGAFGRYDLLGELGLGGMGAASRAWDPQLRRHIALKTIRSGALAGPEEIERFLREARAVAQLNHPHIIKIHDFGEVGGQPFFTMDLAAGSLL